MALMDVERKPETLKAEQLVSDDKMWEARQFAKSQGYATNISSDLSGASTLSIQSPNGTTTETAKINDWVLVTNSTIVNLVPAARAAALYQPKAQ